MKPHEESIACTIQRVTESRTRSDWKHPHGQRRFTIDALRVAPCDLCQNDQVWCSTLDQFAASLCLRARETGRQVLLTVRQVTLHGRFGATSKVFNLVNVTTVQDEVHA